MRHGTQSPRARQNRPSFPKNVASTVSHTVESTDHRPWRWDINPADTQESPRIQIEEGDNYVDGLAYLQDFEDDLETLMMPEPERERSITPRLTPLSDEQPPRVGSDRPVIHRPHPRYLSDGHQSGRSMNRWEYKVWQVEQLAQHTDPQDDPAKFDPRQYLKDISQFTLGGLLGRESAMGPAASTVRDSELSEYHKRRRVVAEIDIDTVMDVPG